MNKQMAWKQLGWKELRQVMPLVTLLLVLTILVLLFQWLNVSSPTAFRSGAIGLCVGLPGLFACGVGAVLVGYEKEIRTLDWLASLPIPPKLIVRIKCLAALICLAGLWLAALLIHYLATGDALGWRGEEWTVRLGVPLHTLFLLLAGFALAWRLQSAIAALLLLAPVALLPTIAAHGVDAVMQRVWEPPASLIFPSTVTLLACQGAATLLAAWLMERWGNRCLTAQRPASSFQARFRATPTAHGLSDERSRGRRFSPASALIWQFARQSRGVLCVTSALLVLSLLLVGFSNQSSSPQQHLVFAIIAGFLAISWLGATVFQSDMVRARIRFLSDRGISPAATWFTRQVLPMGLVAASGIALLALSLNLAADVSTTASGWGRGVGAGLVVGLYLLLAATVFLYSQWTGQVLSSPILAGLAAPLVSLAALYYVAFEIEMLGTPLWLMLLLLPLPACATLLSTRDWMDRRLRLVYWGRHAGFLAVAMLVPAVPFLLDLSQQPGMPGEVASQLKKVADSNPRASLVSPLELVLDAPRQETVQATNSERMWEIGGNRLERIEAQLASSDRAVGASSARVIEYLRSSAMRARLQLESSEFGSTKGSGAENENTLADNGTPSGGVAPQQHYRRAIDLLVGIVRRMRESHRLIDQDAADLVEIWLLTELLQDGARERLGDDLFDEAAGLVADAAARQEARQQAVALSWHRYKERARTRRPSQAGGYTLPPWDETRGTLRGRWVAERRVGRAFADLWQLAERGNEAVTPERLGRVAHFWNAPRGRYGFGSVSEYLRADDLSQFLHPPVDAAVPASQWYAGWEDVARKLVRP